MSLPGLMSTVDMATESGVRSRRPDKESVESFKQYLPDHPSEYVWSDHFIDRMEQPRPPNLPEVAVTLANGELTGCADRRAWAIEHELDGVNVNVIVGIGDEMNPSLVTAYPEITDLGAALSSDLWDDTQVKHAYAGTLLDTQDPLGQEFGRLRIETPLENAWGHDIVTYTGAEYARCVECGRRFEGKGELKRVECPADDY